MPRSSKCGSEANLTPSYKFYPAVLYAGAPTYFIEAYYT